LLALCPAKLSKFLIGVTRDIGAARQAFYENCLSAVANDMSKGQFMITDNIRIESKNYSVNSFGI
jgi:hypothetical protein